MIIKVKAIYKALSLHLCHNTYSKYRTAGVIHGGLIFVAFAVDNHPRKLNPRIIRLLHCLELSITITSVLSAHSVATVLETSN